MYECTNEDVKKIVGTSLRNMPSHARWSQKNPLVTDKENGK